MEIVYYVAASLDGFIATPEGGRASYERCLQFPEWPYAGKPYWVFSTATGNTPSKVVAEMKARGIRRAWLVGGGKLAAAFRAQGLISEHIVSVVPVLLGAGIPLFDGPGPEQSLRLAGSRSYASGIVQLRYLV